jgi:tRNA(fMet)-specific endonuclease VapC
LRFLLDTDHLSILQRGRGAEYGTLAARLSAFPPDDFALCVVSLHEQLLGAHTYLCRARSASDMVRGYALMRQVLSGFAVAEVLPFDARAAAEYERLTGLKLRVAATDLKIASIALSRNLVVLTRNSRDFERVPGLAFEDWTAPARPAQPK